MNAPSLRTALPALLLSSFSLGALGCGSAAGGTETVGATSAAVSASDQVAYDFFVGKGLANYQAAGIVGNLDQESGMNPTVSQYGGGPGRGIAQWSAGGRWDTDAQDNVLWYASTLGESAESLTLQLEFIWYELESFPGYGLASLRATTNVSEATVVFQDDYEGCGECDQSNRISNAEAALGAFGQDPVNIGAPVPGTPASPSPASPQPASPSYLGVASNGTDGGYWIVGSDGGVFSFGNAPFEGSMGGKTLNATMVGMASTPGGTGYWLVGADGGIFAFGDAGFHGSAGSIKLNAPVVGMAATPSGAGYWLVASDGGVFSYGDASFEGSMGGKSLNAPVVGMSATPSGSGYWLTAADGGVFSFGDAAFHGSAGAMKLNAPVVGIASTPTGGGYWLVASDGGIFAYGDAAFFGSMGGKTLNAPIVGMAATKDGNGYWLVAGDGGIFTFGSALFEGSRG